MHTVIGLLLIYLMVGAFYWMWESYKDMELCDISWFCKITLFWPLHLLSEKFYS